MVTGNWLELHEFVEDLVDTSLADTTDPTTRTLMDRDRDDIVDFVEAAMLRQLGLANSGEWLQ